MVQSANPPRSQSVCAANFQYAFFQNTCSTRYILDCNLWPYLCIPQTAYSAPRTQAILSRPSIAFHSQRNYVSLPIGIFQTEWCSVFQKIHLHPKPQNFGHLMEHFHSKRRLSSHGDAQYLKLIQLFEGLPMPPNLSANFID